MKEKYRRPFLFTFSVVMIITGAILAWFVITPTVRSGYVVTMKMDDFKSFTVSPTSVLSRIEVAGDNLFIISNGETTLVGRRTTKPLGWDYDYYYTAELEKAPSGQWVVDKGDGYIRFTSETPMTVTAKYKDYLQIILVGLILIVIVLIYLFMLKATTPK